MLIDVSVYSQSLKKLWADTFGDDEDYINLLFNGSYIPAECFAEIAEGEAISVLYLLKGYIETKSEKIEGRYLYAAATAEKHRGKGLMAKLIREAQQYSADNNISFISLVPADEGLYRYYERFGFEAIMKNYISLSDDNGLSCVGDSISSDEMLLLRKNLAESYFTFAEKEWQYALSCLDYAGYKLIRNSADSYYIISDDNNEVLEYVSAEENFANNTKNFLSRLNNGTKVVSPYDLSDFCKCEENKFGMVYFIDGKFKNIISGDIYMNIALD